MNDSAGNEEANTPNFSPLYWPDGSLADVGQEVRCERAAATRGPWLKFAGRTGKLAAVAPTITESGRTVWIGEVGVELDGAKGILWFKPDELVRLSEGRHGVGKAPQSLELAGMT